MDALNFPLTKNVSKVASILLFNKETTILTCLFASSGTSLKIVPNGRIMVAGFTDGTLRLFVLTGRPSAFSGDDIAERKKHAVVCSKAFQKFGAVACQIHARGVHTSLLMHVDCSEDGLFCFGGVARGSVELVAVDLSRVQYSRQQQDLLDSITVHRHADAKLKGFGACTRLAGPTQKYLLLTGKGIKNIHIWSFEPTAVTEENRWQCLYDTQTNGNTISILHFRKDPHGLLQAVSKSDNQKLRVWDLSFEQHQGDASHKIYGRKSVIAPLARKAPLLERPKRPPYVDVASTESALGIAGALSFGGGYNQVSVVGLDVENVTSPYNITEMALPVNPASHQTSRRQQRGDLQSIIRVAGMSKDACHVLLELSNVRFHGVFFCMLHVASLLILYHIAFHLSGISGSLFSRPQQFSSPTTPHVSLGRYESQYLFGSDYAVWSRGGRYVNLQCQYGPWKHCVASLGFQGCSSCGEPRGRQESIGGSNSECTITGRRVRVYVWPRVDPIARDQACKGGC
jgi:hypothetical protein